jgi:hypothetical protein
VVASRVVANRGNLLWPTGGYRTIRGKGVFLNTLTGILGDYAATDLSEFEGQALQLGPWASAKPLDSGRDAPRQPKPFSSAVPNATRPTSLCCAVPGSSLRKKLKTVSNGPKAKSKP